MLDFNIALFPKTLLNLGKKKGTKILAAEAHTGVFSIAALSWSITRSPDTKPVSKLILVWQDWRNQLKKTDSSAPERTALNFLCVVPKLQISE